MSRTLKIIIAVNLAILAALVFIYPHLMVGPGKLIPGHNALESNCFACHAPFTGTASAKCATCHKPADIGRLTTLGVKLAKPATTTAFHQKLLSQDCVACHSDHAGVKRFAPQGRFNHNLLQKEARDACQTCHKMPTDVLHQQITGNCLQCHTQDRWKPATFDHDKFFSLDGDHNVTCVTCHPRNDYKSYTCYGCHEHTLANIRRKHVEEGIAKYDNCVECHRSADGEPGEGGGKGKENRD